MVDEKPSSHQHSQLCFSRVRSLAGSRTDSGPFSSSKMSEPCSVNVYLLTVFTAHTILWFALGYSLAFGEVKPSGREFFIDNLLVRVHFIIVMIGWTGLEPWGFEFPFPGSLTTTFLPPNPRRRGAPQILTATLKPDAR